MGTSLYGKKKGSSHEESAKTDCLQKIVKICRSILKRWLLDWSGQFAAAQEFEKSPLIILTKKFELRTSRPSSTMPPRLPRLRSLRTIPLPPPIRRPLSTSTKHPIPTSTYRSSPLSIGGVLLGG